MNDGKYVALRQYILQLLKLVLHGYFYVACAWFGFFVVALGVVLLLQNTVGLPAANGGIPRFPQLTFFAAVMLDVSTGWIVVSALVRTRRRALQVSWALVAAMGLVAAGLAFSGAFAKGPWLEHEPSRVGFTWVFCSAVLGGLLIVKRLREQDWWSLRRLLRLCDRADQQDAGGAAGR